MNDAILLQHVYSGSEHARLIAATFARHADYCRYWRMDYEVNMSGETSGGDWVKVDLIAEALMAGYKHVIYLDADAMIYDVCVDLRRACVMPINAVVYENPATQPNVGALYLRNSAEARLMIGEWLARKPGFGPWWEQNEFAAMCQKWQEANTIGWLDNAWNSVDWISPSPAPIVMAWHGYLDVPARLAKMRAAMRNYRKPNPLGV